MALSNYSFTLTGTSTDPYVDLSFPRTGTTADQGSGQVNTGDLATTRVYTIEPASDLLMKARNGRFSMIFGADGSFTPDPNGEFTFFHQGLAGITDGGFVFTVRTENNTFQNGYHMGVSSVNRAGQVQGNFLEVTVPIVATTNGRVFQVEWFVNEAELVPLSQDVANPSLPTLSMTLRANNDGVDPDDVVTYACLNIDTDFLFNQDPLPVTNLGNILLKYGGGMYDPLNDTNNVFLNNQFSPGLASGPGSGLVNQQALLAQSGGFPFTDGYIQNFFALLDGFPGHVSPIAGVQAGWIEPQSVETWTLGAGFVGWRFDLIGQSTLAIPIIVETWPDVPNPPPSVTVIEEDWES